MKSKTKLFTASYRQRKTFYRVSIKNYMTPTEESEPDT